MIGSNQKDEVSILFLGSQMETAGAQRILLLQASWFHERGYQVKAAFFYDKEGLYELWKRSVHFPLINLEGWGNKNRVVNGFRLLRALARLYRLMRQERFLAIETFTHHANLLGMPLAWAAKVPVRIASHHGNVENLPPWMERLHSKMINQGIATELVAVSERVRQLAIEEEGIETDRVIVIPNGIDLSDGDNLSADEERSLRQSLGVSADSFLIINVGRLRNQKGQAYLLEAIPEIIQHYPQTIFAIAGDGPLRPSLEAKARNLGVDGCVRFLGNRSDVPRLLRIADVFALPSLWEGLPVALLEAMDAGLPIVATQVEGVEDVITDGVNGLLVPQADVQALSRGIIRLLSDGNLRTVLGESGKSLMKEKYSLQSMCEKYENLFQRKVEVKR